MLKTMNVATITDATFYKNVHDYLQPAVLSIWSDTQRSLFDAMKQRRTPITIGGDMRADSPGHSAKYGSYTTMDLSTNQVIDVQLIQVSSFFYPYYSKHLIAKCF